jgi:hypothetical protein
MYSHGREMPVTNTKLPRDGSWIEAISPDHGAQRLETDSNRRGMTLHHHLLLNDIYGMG